MEDESAEGSGPSQTRPVSDQANNTTISGMLARLTAQGNPLKSQGETRNNSPGK